PGSATAGPMGRSVKAATPTSGRAATGVGSALRRISDASDMGELEILQELNRHYIRSVQESDVRWFEVNLADDFLNSNPDGTLVDRAAFLKQIAPPCPVKNLQAEDVRVRILGDVAIIHARTTYVKPGGEAGAL